VTLWTLLDNSARTWPDRPAVSVGDRLHSRYGALARDALGLSGALQARGLQPHDRVLLAMPNGPDYLTMLFACWHAGLTAVPVNARLHAREIASIAEDVSAALCVTGGALTDALSAVLSCPLAAVDNAAFTTMVAGPPGPRRPTRPEDIAWIFYTSGTTGQPKGAMLSHRNLMAMALSYLADVEPLKGPCAFLHLGAQSHACGLFGLSFIARGGHHVLPASGGYDAAELRTLIAHVPGLTLFAAPTLLRRMVGDGALRAAPVQHMGTVLTGAMPVLPQDLIAAVDLFGPRVWNGYGQGESPCTITHMPQERVAEAVAQTDKERLASVGFARTGMAVRILDAQGRAVSAETVGQVCVAGETVMAGYWGRPQASAEALSHGWLRTGDQGRMDERGILTLVGRAKDLIISGGLNVYPAEVEPILAAQPGVADVAVLGLPDAEWGERVTAAVVPADPNAPPSPEALDQACLSALARFKRPRLYRFVEDLPRNANGKVMKATLRQQCLDADAPGDRP